MGRHQLTDAVGSESTLAKWMARVTASLMGPRESWLLVAVALLTGFIAVQTPSFLSLDNLLSLSRSFSWIAIAALGEGVVIVTGGIDFSVTAVMALAGHFTAIAAQVGWPPGLAVGVGLLIGTALGCLNGLLVAHVRIPAFLATLATMALARGLLFGLTGGWPVLNLPSSLRVLGQGSLSLRDVEVPVPVVVMLACAAGTWFLLKVTTLGRYVQLLGRSEEALRLAGVHLETLKTFVYAVSGFTAALAGILMTARLGVAAPTAAAGYEIDIIAVAVLGGARVGPGTPNPWAVLLSAALLQMVRSGLALLGTDPYWQTAIVGVFLLAAIAADRLQERDR